nr:integrase, catalytic region, zinc finger, CCHC-type, peptidase aspartic, catalytic [Tanacetum cinerariifolium]
MSIMQLNSKFVNNMFPEWGRFVTSVKQNKGLRDSNYDQLYAYLNQHEAHANENKMILDRFTQYIVDPLALISNVSHQQHYLESSTTPPSTYVQPHFADNTQLDLRLSPKDNLIENLTNTLALLTQSYKIYLPQTNNQLITSSNTRSQATLQDDMVVVQNVLGRQNRGHENNARDTGAASHEGAQNRVGNANLEYFKDKMLLMQARENRVAFDKEQLANDCAAFATDNDETPTTQIMFMANLSSTYPVYNEVSLSYDSDILSEVPDHDNYHDADCEHHEVVQIVLWYLDSGCSKHMMGDRSRLKNFKKKFIETVRFGNDQFGAIKGYGDYVIGDSVISMVSATPYVPPTNNDLEILFQPMFDEYLKPPRVERPGFPAPAVTVPFNSAGTPSSTTIDQDTPSPSHSP